MLRRPKLKTEIGMKAKFNNELYFLYVCKTKEKFLSKIQKIIVQSIYRTGRVRILSVGRNAPAGATTMGAEIFVLPGASAATKGSFPRRTFLIIFMVKYLVYYFLDHFRS